MTLAVVAITWGLLAIALHASRPGTSLAILGWAIAFRIVAFIASPVLEDDHYRFLWDGYRFAEAGSPYIDPPAAHFADSSVQPKFRAILDRINYPDVPTVYGPVSEWAFWLAYEIAPAELWSWKLILLLADLAIVGLLWLELDSRGQLLLAWCPLTIFETGFNAHPDTLAIAILIAAWRMNRASYIYAAAALAGVAVLAKIFALLLVPFLAVRWTRGAWLVALGTMSAIYLPFWMQGSAGDLAGLRAMGTEWEFNSTGFALVASISSPDFARFGCAFGMGIVGLLLVKHWWALDLNQQIGLPPGQWIYGSFLFLSATVNPWYCLWLLPFVAVRMSLAGIATLAAVSLAYVTGLNLGDTALGNFEHPWWVRPLEVATVLTGWSVDCLRRRNR